MKNQNFENMSQEEVERAMLVADIEHKIQMMEVQKATARRINAEAAILERELDR